MTETLAGLLLFSILGGLFVFLKRMEPKPTSSDKEVVVVTCSKCGVPYLKIEVSKHC